MSGRRISKLTTGSSASLSNAFGPDTDDIIPGEIVIALHSEAAAGITTSVPNLPLRGMLADARWAVTALGISALDTALAKLEVTSIARVHGPTPPVATDGVAVANDFGLDTVFRIRYDAATKPDTVADRIGKLNDVLWAEPNRYRQAYVVPNDPMFGQQWGLTRIGCPEAWDRTTGSAAVTVAVIDTGIDLNHPDLAPLIVPGQDLVDWAPGSTPSPGWVLEGDFTGVDANAQDEVGHGTHVAGTISCLTNNGVGVAGVNWTTRLMPVRVLARARQVATGRISGFGSSANIAAGIRWAADHGAQVINMSLGGYSNTNVEREAVAYAVARGVVVVAAMGNDNTASPSYPAAYPDVIAVGATDSADHRASFSNTGSWIDVAGPGVQVQSTYWDNTYASLSGTSMATPHVAGVAALILSVAPGTSAAQVGNILRTTAKPLRDNPADPVPNDRYGHGLVQAAAAVAAAAPPPKTTVVALCPSVMVVCQSRVCPSTPVVCKKSQVVICNSQLVTCHPSVVCPTVTPVCKAPSALVACPSLVCPSVACQSVACQSAACLPQPGAGEADFEAYDPYGYDPYGDNY